jgi:hypothetical protein
MTPKQELISKIATFFVGFASGAIVTGALSIISLKFVNKKYTKDWVK